MQAGERDQLVTFERETRTREAGGGMTSSWTPLGQAWAKVDWIRGGEADWQGAVRELVVYRFTVLSAAVDALALTTKDRIAWAGDTYNIRERPRRLRTLPETQIIAEAGVTL